jgi:dsRNA-specific ribonuclease
MLLKMIFHGLIAAIIVAGLSAIYQWNDKLHRSNIQNITTQTSMFKEN